jgi:hypothetical protein
MDGKKGVHDDMLPAQCSEYENSLDKLHRNAPRADCEDRTGKDEGVRPQASFSAGTTEMVRCPELLQQL